VYPLEESDTVPSPKLEPLKMKKTANTAVSLAALLGALTVTANAATITFLGNDTTTGANWRTTTTTKPDAFDPNDDNAYGNDGYLVGYGTSATATVSSYKQTPSYLSSLTYNISTPYYTHSPYFDYDNPTQPIGTSVSDINSGTWYKSGTGNNPNLNVFSFTVGTATKFVLTVLYGVSDNNAPNSITVVQTAGSGSGTATSTGLINST
jgi:hypothetical protein